MADFSTIKTQLSKFEEYERELHLRQLQINGLLSITQAINTNHSSAELFQMYRDFLSFTMSIKKMALYFLREGKWECVTHIGLNESVLEIDATPTLQYFKKVTNVVDKSNVLLRHFDNIIPVFHKETPISHLLLGGSEGDKDWYSKVQFITALTNIITVAIENKRLFKHQLDQARYKHEMKLANEMQRSLVPMVMPKGSFFELASEYIPHFSVGGDYYDFIQFDDNQRLMCCVADIAGKGFSAALLMANFQANLRSIVRRRDSPEEFIKMLNAAIYRITNGDRYITFFIAEFDERTRILRYVNAGHTPPYLYMNEALESLTEGCTFLGCFEKLPTEIQVGEIHIPTEAFLVSFTDGVIDVCNPKKERFEEERMADFIRKEHQQSAADFNKKLLQHLDAFRNGEEYTDDFTLVTLKILA